MNGEKLVPPNKNMLGYVCKASFQIEMISREKKKRAQVTAGMQRNSAAQLKTLKWVLLVDC